MKAKYLRKNINATKREVMRVAREYNCRVEWYRSPKTPDIYVDFVHKALPRHKRILFTTLPEDKIAYGLYKPAMVAYNMERKLRSWLEHSL